MLQDDLDWLKEREVQYAQMLQITPAQLADVLTLFERESYRKGRDVRLLRLLLSFSFLLLLADWVCVFIVVATLHTV